MKKLLLLSILLITSNSSIKNSISEKSTKHRLINSFTYRKDSNKKLNIDIENIKNLTRSEINPKNLKEKLKINLIIKKWNEDLKNKKIKNTPFIDQKKNLVRITDDFKKILNCQSKSEFDKKILPEILKTFKIENTTANFYNLKEFIDYKNFPNFEKNQRKILLKYYLKHSEINMCKSDYKIFKTLTNVPTCIYSNKNKKIYKSYPLPNLTYYEILENNKLIKEFYKITNLFFMYIPAGLSREDINKKDSNKINSLKMGIEKVYNNPEFIKIINEIIKKAFYLDSIFEEIDCGAKTFVNFYFLLMRFYKIYVSKLPSYTKDIFYKKFLDLKTIWTFDIVENFSENFYFVNFIAVFLKEIGFQNASGFLEDSDLIRFGIIMKDFHETVMSIISRMLEFEEYMVENYKVVAMVMEDIERILGIGITETKDISYVLKSQQYHYSVVKSNSEILKKFLVVFVIILFFN